MIFLIPNDEHMPPSKFKQELIGDCLHFYLMNLLRCVDIILNKIGEGGFGNVYLCFNGKRDYKKLLAMKCIKSSDLINSAKRERQFGYVAKLNSEYLVKYHETFTFYDDLYVVMEYFKDGNLSDFIKGYREGNKRVREWVYFYFI
jgi:serine/threonine protein kinase